jgi:L-ascorbate metabolism protein UlaG (beta-lactamase superfamily)
MVRKLCAIVVFGACVALVLAATTVSPALAAGKGETKLHWYGHSAWKITTPSGGVILIDPWLTAPTNPDKNSIAELGRVDYILITHGHRDHVVDAVEIGKKTGATLLAPYGLTFNMVSVLGYPKDQALTGGNVGGTIDLPKAGAKVMIVQAIHGSELTVPQIPPPGPGQPTALASGNPVGYVLMIKDGPTIYHTGDTEVFEDMKLIPMFHHIDVMLACIGGYFTMDPAHAALAVQFVKPTHVIPDHFGTFGLLAGTPDQFRAALAKRKLTDKLIVMKPGGDHSF